MTEKDQPKFSFHFVTLEETLKGVALLSDKKAPQASDGPVKMIERKSRSNSIFLLHNFNNTLSSSEYSASLK